MDRNHKWKTLSKVSEEVNLRFLFTLLAYFWVCPAKYLLLEKLSSSFSCLTKQTVLWSNKRTCVIFHHWSGLCFYYLLILHLKIPFSFTFPLQQMNLKTALSVKLCTDILLHRQSTFWSGGWLFSVSQEENQHHCHQQPSQPSFRMYSKFNQISRKYKLMHVSIHYCYANIRSWLIFQSGAIKPLQK